MKYARIKQHSSDYSITTLCTFMTVSRSCYYDWLDSPKTDRGHENEQLLEILKILFEKGRSTYGTRRLKKKLAEPGFFVSRRRIGRLMNQAGLWCKTKKKFKATTNSKHSKPIAPNRLTDSSQYQTLTAIMSVISRALRLKKADCIWLLSLTCFPGRSSAGQWIIA